MPEWISKFLSVKLATLMVGLYFISTAKDWKEILAVSVVTTIFIIAKTIQNIMLKDKETNAT